MAAAAFFRSERTSAIGLLAAAVVGLVIANGPLAEAAFGIRSAQLGAPAFHLSLAHWISDGLLAVFFFAAAAELKHEVMRGALNSPTKALRPAIAAVFGVAVPAAIYLAVAGTGEYGRGWPIPTATDIAFALGVLALFGRGLPVRIRAFLLGLAVIDDLIAIVIIAVFFTASVDLAALGIAVLCVVAVALLGRIRHRWAIAPVVVAALATWFFVHESGVHATIAGVAVALALPLGSAESTRRALEPYVNWIVLPLFALSAAMVAIPQLGISELAPAFWGIALALPVGKVLGITVGGLIGTAVDQRRLKPDISRLTLMTVGALGGIGFTVSLLMNELAFSGRDEIRAEGTLAVLLGSGVSLVVSAVLVTVLTRRQRSRAEDSAEAVVGTA